MNKRELSRFSTALTKRAVEYSETEFELRAGGTSHWYVDHRVGLGNGYMIQKAGGLIVAKARDEGIIYSRVAGAGVGGWALAQATAWQAQEKFQKPIYWVMANLDKKDYLDLKNGYGLHGGDVYLKHTLLVDDIGSTGSSLLELADMVRANRGIVEHAINVSDRSNGKVAEALAKIGVEYHYLLEFNEETGSLIPAEQHGVNPESRTAALV